MTFGPSIMLGIGARLRVGGLPEPVLQLAGVGTPGVTQGFTALPQVTSYTATAGRFRRTASGFVRCSANEERLCFDASGNFTGQYLQGADTYNSAPWDDAAAPHTSSDPAYLTTSAGGTIAYAGAHSDADIFGTTGKGVLITQTSTQNGFHTANNVTATGVAVGDFIRGHAIVAISSATIAGQVTLRVGSSAHIFTHDSSGVITGQTESWTARRAGFYDMGTINGKRWWYIWAELKAASTSNVAVGIGFGNVTADAGKKLHVCELMIQKNPLTAPAAVPVCATTKTFAADTLVTGLSGFGFVMNGCALARSQIVSGNIAPPAVNIGVPYEPLETRINIVRSVEVADRAGIMPNPNQLLYGRTWGTPTTVALTFGPGWFPRDWYKGTASGEVAANVTVRSVFQAREDLRPILGNMTTSQTYITAALNIDGVILMAGGDTRTKYMEQADVLAGTGSSFHFIAGTNVSVTNCLAVGSTLWPTRARHLIQQDADATDAAGAKSVYMGELTLQSSGGALSLKGTRTHNLARTSVTAVAAATNVTLDTDQFCATQFWMDQLFIDRGTYTNWTGDQMFGALTTAHNNLFFCQSERAIQISTDSGGTWGALSPSFDVKTMPHGFLAEHIGTWDFDAATFTSAPNAAKSLRVRYWAFDSISSPAINKPGFQFLASQMDFDTYERYPENGDVFRIKNGTQWIDLTYQGGFWTGSGYTRYTGAQINNPLVLEAAISNDFIQISRTSVTMTGSNTLDGNVMIGPKGAYFLTGNPTRTGSDTTLDNYTVANTVVVSDGTNGFRWDHSRLSNSDASLSNALFIEARSEQTYSDGSGKTLSIGAAGAGNILTFGSNVTVITGAGGGGLAAASSGATYVNSGNVTTIAAGQRSAYGTFTTPSAKVAQYLPTAFYDTVQGRAVLPSYDQIFDFDLTAFADTDAGFGARAIIAAAKGTHARWNAMITDMKAKWHKVPDLVATTANTASVGTNLGAATGLIDRRYGGDHARLFEVVSGQLQVRGALTGLNAVFMLRTTTGQLLVVDVTT